MRYNFDIDKWVNLVLSTFSRKTNRVKLLQSHFKPLQTLMTEFEAFRNDIYFKTKYNSQQKVLKGLLNKLFDPIHKRIQVVTSSDIKPIFYQFNSDELNPDLKYGYFATETNPNPFFGYYAIEYVNSVRFIVKIPTDCDTAEIRASITAWVNYYRFESMNFKIILI